MLHRPILLKKVRVHNLKNVDLSLDSGELVVFTGVSGSGKSSLAFDTIFVEGQRRYIESLSHQVRRSLADLSKPEAESITGIAPTIAIEQKQGGNNPRSTVGTMTGIYDFLRVLFARIGIPHCPVSGEAVAAQSTEKMISRVLSLKEGTKVVFLSPFARQKRSEFREEFAELLSKGFSRIRVDGEWVEIGEIDRLSADTPHDVDLVVDRIAISEENRSRVKEAIQQALDLGNGLFSIYNLDAKEETVFSRTAYSAASNLSYPPLEPHDFSFNHPSGMCPTCHGLGISQEFDFAKIIDPDKSIAEDCCAIGSSYQTVRFGNIYNNLARLYDFDIDAPWKKLPERAKQVFLYGTEKKWTAMRFVHPETKKRWEEYVQWRGVIQEAKDRLAAAKSDLYRRNLAELMIEAVCPACKGARIKPYPAATELGGKHLFELTEMPLSDLAHFFETLELSPIDAQVGEELIKEIRERISFLLRVGLHYLSLGRSSPTLSGGESQRVRLASQVGAGLVGAIYILDEPSIGLHPVDHHKLIDTLMALRDLGNTVLVVEHDGDTILAADRIVDVGPGAGADGGQILCNGSLEELFATKESLTAGYLSGRLKIERPKHTWSAEKFVKIVKASHHNLKKLTVSIPLEGLVCVTGVSGSGKSSLITDILLPALSNELQGSSLSVGTHQKIEGIEHLDKVIGIDQSPIGRTPRSNAATYIKLFDEIRDLFAQLPESKLRGFTASHFSFNVKEGTCPYCNGMGEVKLDMDFMEEAIIECPQCKGRRFDPEILSIQFKGKNIYDILETDVDGALLLFESFPSIRKKLEMLAKVGLGYLKLGQPSTTLSGGEAQRIKLAKELVRPATGRTLYIFDEPTTGLHFHDVQRLVQVLHELAMRKNTVLVIEHNMDLVKTADWVIELGPEAGSSGGELIAEGSPQTLAKGKTPTGRALKGLGMPTKNGARKIAAIDKIQIQGASQNNLKNIDVEIPRGSITVLSGPSGSGKSSLAFETLYAEGQRRYTETLPSYARQFIKQLPKPKVERIEGLSPTIALEQKTGGLNPRSTVGTITEVYDLLRVLYSHLGQPYCPETGEPIRHISKEYVVQRLLELPLKEKIALLSPLTAPRKDKFQELLERLSKEGYLRIRLNKTYYELDEEIPYETHRINELMLVIDRLTIDPKNEQRLFEGIEKATSRSDGIVIVAKEKEDLYYNLSFAVEKTGKSYPPITPQSFSFNSQQGMCSECQGLGMTFGAHLEENRDLLEMTAGEILDQLWKEKGSEKAFKLLKIDLHEPLENLSAKDQNYFFHGDPKEAPFRWLGLQKVIAAAGRMGKRDIKEALLPYLTTQTCSACQGERLSPLARNVRIGSLSLPGLTNLSIDQAIAFLETLSLETHGYLKEAHTQILKSLRFLVSLGLSYLTMSRSAPTLSGGELQRLRLARQLGSGLTSCLYILDEPTIGLHPHNNVLLNQALKSLRDLGNTLLLVEHDPMTLKVADYLIDFGPKAGKEGGKIVAQGTLPEILANPHSLTGQYLSGAKKIPIPKERRKATEFIEIQNATLHNLQNISVKIPKGAITCLTGVSGSGKSTLMRHLLKPAAEQGKTEYLGATFKGLQGFEKVVSMDQAPIGQTARADVSTYTELQPFLRSHYSLLPLAQSKGLQPRHFSPNQKRGMCRTCYGLGYKMIDLQFMPSVRVPCEACHGYRLNPVSLEVKYKGKHLGQVLEMTVEEALLWFETIPRIRKRLDLLISVGLGYLQLGQEIASLSGGEAQRLRLSRELAKRESGKTLYLIDEPTVGLHPEDIARLIPIFQRLADKKNTVILIEHNLDVIANADYLIDLGPDAGIHGGKIIAEGTPEKVARSKKSKTAPYLASLFTFS